MTNHNIPETVQRELLAPHAATVRESIRTGLSSAKVWRCDSAGGPACLRRWPDRMTADRLTMLHEAIQVACDSELSFVPSVYRSRSGNSFVPAGQFFWELTRWLPGKSDYRLLPSDARLQCALSGLARLHRTWQSHRANWEPSPAIVERVSTLKRWLCCDAGPVLDTCTTPLERAMSEDTFRAIHRIGPELVARMQNMLSPVRVHFVLRDIWSEHVLFLGDELTGIIDFGAGRYDDPATDVARLMGSLEPFDLERREMGLHYYQAEHSELDPERVWCLDQAGALLSAAQWLQWLVMENRDFVLPRSNLLMRWQHHLARLT